jgi:hypothetical protein
MQQQQQSEEIKAYRIQFQKMISQAPESQKESIRKIKNFVIDTLKKLENILKKTTHTNQDYCINVVGLKIKMFSGSMINTYTLVSENPKKAKKFITMLSKLSLNKMEKPFKNLEKVKGKISKMTEEECEIYAECVAKPLETYLIKKAGDLNALTVN